ncbi:MAG: tyrosine--tRNA ligase [Negativicutes bacterium]|jgi:tyrosyl-tRNA synthetase
MSVFDTLVERGLLQQLTHEDEIKEILATKRVAFYTGYDPTADSLHVGHYLSMMVMAHMQRAGHRPIVLIGGATAMIGDPSGKSDMRKMLTPEQIEYNGAQFKAQMSTLLDFSDGKAIVVNNADWILPLNYMQVLRDLGPHFSVNRMLAAECYKQRLEKGLTFLELNYMVMQAYDFLELNRKYDCVLQLGGDDQWSNILAGVDLIRKKERRQALGLTFTLLATSDGKKMGKTERGAVWLDVNKTSVHDFYQYWRNVADADVEKCLALLTFLPMTEVRRLGALRDQAINEAKKVLAYEVTKIVHGESEANQAAQAAEALFGGGGALDNVPTIYVTSAVVGKNIVDVLVENLVFASKGEARRMIAQGGLYIGENRHEDIDAIIASEAFVNSELLIRKGKKNYYRFVIKNS